MDTINEQGLKRYIPSEVRRKVRQRCGFGCVRCGNPIIQYEHFDPPFSKASKHFEEGITLLCGGCHDKKTRGIISLETIRTHNANPKSLEIGYNREIFDITSRSQKIKFCGTNYYGVKTIIGIHEKEILTVNPAECEGAPITISALFHDIEGNEILKIENNEWISNSYSWDIEIKGPTLIIRKSKGDIALQIKTTPPDTLEIEKVSMFYNGVLIEGNSESLEIKGANGSSLKMTVKNFFGNGKGVALAVTKSGITYGYHEDYESLLANENRI